MAERDEESERTVRQTAGHALILGDLPPGVELAWARVVSVQFDSEKDESLGRVLVAEDDLAIRALLISLLRRRGYVVVEAQDGQVAMERIETEPFDAIVLDLMMPRKSGFELIDDLKKDRREDVLKCCIVLSAASEKHRESLDRAALFAIVAKPFDIHELCDVIQRCVEQSRSEQ